MEEHLLKTENLSKSYRKKKIVDAVSIYIQKGEVVGLLGPNGAGKTTTFYMIVGLISPDKGKIFFDNKDITKMPMYKRARCGLGYLSQEPSIFRKLTVEENILAVLETLHLGKKEIKSRLAMRLEELKLTSLAANPAYTLSGGERRRLEITRCLVTNPSFILLDEPFSGVDPIAVFEVQQMIADLKNKGLGILLTDHNVRETLSITDRSYIMTEGKIFISGNAQELINNPEAKKVYLGEKFVM
ncbi:MAG: LPS export ABC transporter ATP-binding protein [Candidatus Omnitrophica bacterium]|nr:LPS export ABC transporter ATP-binding protein [Candidatus Omnitrophota bacterium]MBU1925862.1 LPS export ABC transporter ATP-binding protein [Candidatus Omnitrophota bacterium]